MDKIWRFIDKMITDRCNQSRWTCGHRWCYREATYDYRCHLHQGDK